MKRLAITLLALVLLAAPVAIEAQPAGKIHRIAYLGGTLPPHPAFLQGYDQLGTRHLGHPEVRDHDVEGVHFEATQGFHAVRDHIDGVPGSCQDILDDGQDRGIVVDREHAPHWWPLGARGMKPWRATKYYRRGV